MMNIPVPQSGQTGPSSSSPAAKPQPKSSAASKSSFADELAKGNAADSAQPKPKTAGDKAKSPVGDRDERSALSKPDDKGADKAGDAQAKAQESAKKLAPLKKAAASTKQAIDNAPVVALLTGHLERVVPTDIPDLVSGNAFVADAIGEANLADFMNKPAAIGDILEDLELPQGLADIAEQMGLDLKSVVTPSELLRAIGVDPGKVMAELTNLKTSLGAEGLAPYMRKAAQLAEQMGAQPAQPLEPYPGWAKTTTPPAVPQSPVTGAFDPTKVTQTGTGVAPTMPSTKVAATTPAATTPAAASPPAGIVTAEDLRDLVDGNPYAALGLTPQELLKMLTPGMAADGVKSSGKEVTNLSPGAQPLSGLGGLGVTQFNPADLNLASNVQSLDLSGAPVAPTMNNATFDAFNLLGDKLKTMETQTVDMTKVPGEAKPADVIQLQPKQVAASGRTLEEQLQSVGTVINPVRSLSPQPELKVVGGDQTVKMPISADSPLAVQTDVKQLGRADAKPQLEIAPSDVTERIAAKPAAFAAAPQMKDLAPRAMNVSQAIPADELRLTAPLMAGRGGEAKGQDFGGQGKEERPKDDGASFTSFDRAMGEVGAGKTQHVASHGKSGFAVNNTPELGLTSEQRLDMFQKVMDRATSLMNDGGGVVRLDFGSSGLGQLEMAVKMNDDKMDLKILTGSDRVKEAVMSELGKLRDALSVQNVQLGQVDVGVGGRQHQQPQGFNFNQGGGHAFQQQQQAFSGDGRQAAERRASEALNVDRLAEIRRPMPSFAASQILSNSSGGAGRISVRV